MNKDLMVKRAMVMAENGHAGQVDKCGKPYIDHVKRVALTASGRGNINAMIVGYLHDLVEDTDVSLKDIYENFGNKILEAVDAMTHRRNEPYVEYLKRVKSNHIATVVKMADLLDNMNPRRCVRIKSQRDFERTSEILLPRYAKAYRELARLTGEFTK